MARQASALDELIQGRWRRSHHPLLDIAAGIGTQALGLANLGYPVFASDLSHRALSRARAEAQRQGLRLPTCAADFVALPYRSHLAGLVLAADNSLPHLLTDEAILQALRECRRCLRPGGGLVLTIRDYGPPPAPGTVEHHPYGWRRWGDQDYYVDQEWHWNGPHYDLRITASRSEGAVPDHEFRGRYYAIPVAHLHTLCTTAGFVDVDRQDGRYYQPVILATAPAVG
jgi:glycine/sarcosine N-methyltransferase